MQEMSHYVVQTIFRDEDPRVTRELEIRRVRAARGRQERRREFYAYARGWRDFLFGAGAAPVHG